ncbi:hypothetical protein CRYUN_Cryun14cG0145700 [Craigia yunnanensis]
MNLQRMWQRKVTKLRILQSITSTANIDVAIPIEDVGVAVLARLSSWDLKSTTMRKVIKLMMQSITSANINVAIPTKDAGVAAVVRLLSGWKVATSVEEAKEDMEMKANHEKLKTRHE